MSNSDGRASTYGADFKWQLEAYYTHHSNPSGVRSLEQLIAFNYDHPELEMPPTYESMSRMEAALPYSRANASYLAIVSNDTFTAQQIIHDTKAKYNVSAFVFPSPQNAGWYKAMFPQVTVPMGFLPDDTVATPYLNTATVPPSNYSNIIYDPYPGKPHGLTFASTEWTEAQLLSYAYAFEQATHVRLQKKAYAEAVPKTQLYDVL